MKMTFAKHDKLERGVFARQFQQFLITEHHFADDALVVSLNASFGSGKSYFLEMWRNDLLEQRKEDSSIPLPILINAWESDFCGDPLTAILSEFQDALAALPIAEEGKIEKLKTGILKMAAMGGNLLNQYIKKKTDYDVAEAWRSGGEIRSPEQAGTQVLAEFKERQDAMESLKTELEKLFSGENPKAIIMVDELDRCRPDFAIHYLETIKHIFSTRGLIFVLAVDHRQLAATAKALFGNDMDFPEYYRKFASRQVSLPAPDETVCSNYCIFLAGKFLTTPEGQKFRRYSGIDDGSEIHKRIAQLTRPLGLTPRRLKEVFRIIGHATAMHNPQDNSLAWAWANGLILMAALQVAGHPLYEALKSSNATQEEVFRDVGKLLAGCRHQEFWIKLAITGTLTAAAEWPSLTNELFPLYAKYQVRPKHTEITDFSRHLQEFDTGWMRDGSTAGQSCLSVIAKYIETVQRFFSR